MHLYRFQGTSFRSSGIISNNTLLCIRFMSWRHYIRVIFNMFLSSWCLFLYLKIFHFIFFYFIVGRDVILPLHRYVKSILGSPFLRFSRDESFDKKNMPFAYDAFMKSDNHLTASVKIHEYSIVFQFSFLLLLDCRQTQICSY